MYVGSLFLISALLVANARCDCDEYIQCFGELLRDFFTNIKVDEHVNSTKKDSKTQVFDLSDHEGNIDTVFSEITSFIKNIDFNIKQKDVVDHQHNKTKIVVKTFDFDDDFKKEDATEPTSIPTTTEDVTTEFNILDVLHLNDVTTTELTTTENNYSVIPLESEKENVITNEIDKSEDDNFSDYLDIDYVEFYKDTTNEPVVYIPTDPPTSTEYNELRAEIDRQENEIENIIEHSIHMLNDEALSNIIVNVTNNNVQPKKDTVASTLFPWVAAIFYKNDSNSNQFDYFCDGAVLNDRSILTAARCVHSGNETYTEDNFIVILGKTSLQVSGGSEKILRVKALKPHGNFTIENGDGKNDLAIIVLEEPIAFNDGISAAVLIDGEDVSEEDGEAMDTVTTAWSPRGDLTLIYFDKGKSKACETDNKVENTLCATYGDAVPLCPSYGGLYATKRAGMLYLNGIRTGNPLDRGVCFSKDVTYTSLQNYTQWISENVVNNK